MQAQQNQPLLSPGQHLPGPEYPYSSQKQRNKRPPVGLIAGSLVALALLVMFVMSVWKPRALHEYVVGADGQLVEVDVSLEDTVEEPITPPPVQAVKVSPEHGDHNMHDKPSEKTAESHHHKRYFFLLVLTVSLKLTREQHRL